MAAATECCMAPAGWCRWYPLLVTAAAPDPDDDDNDDEEEPLPWCRRWCECCAHAHARVHL